ncbi:CCHC-type domain-containing protein [Mycena venus]|uniref:CCHC-type domain-containing protein n=1 Tax=Mycena venus TaxID=2733690 RepID=A0A8H7CST6_9AGAR|nr:CCHC-type domain-containing protein [Mycena venus]
MYHRRLSHPLAFTAVRLVPYCRLTVFLTSAYQTEILWISRLHLVTAARFFTANTLSSKSAAEYSRSLANQPLLPRLTQILAYSPYPTRDAIGRFLPRPRTADPDSSDESSLTLSSIFSSRGLPSPRTPATSPVPAPDPVALHTALTTISAAPVLEPSDTMTDANPRLFRGDGINENATDFLNTIRRRNLLSPTWKDEEKLEFFELSLKSGSYAKSWYNKLPATEKDTFKNLAAAFQKQWPEKEMAEKEKGELHEELLSLVLRPEDVGVRIEEDGIQEWGHVRWAIKAAELAAHVGDSGGLVPQVLKNIPDSLLLRLGPKRGTWPELVQTMKDVPSTDITSVRRMETRLAGLETLITNTNATIASLQRTPTRGLTAAFSGMAASSPARNDPVRRNLFPAAAANPAGPMRAYRPDAERLQMILGAPVVIHACNAAGLAAYNQQIAAYTQKHGSRKPSEERPYPLTPGTAAVGSGECHKCGLIGHYSANCTTSNDLLIPDVEVRWRQIVQSIQTCAGRTAPAATTAVNIVADADDTPELDVFGTAEYDQSVIEEYLRSQGKVGGPSA